MEDMDILCTSISLVLLLFGLNFLMKTRQGSNKNLPPSPRALPIIGHIHLLKSPLHRSFQCLSEKYGKIFSLQLGNQFAVIVSSPSAVQECFTKNDVILANRPRLIMGKYIGYNYTTLGSSSYGEHWRNLRRIGTLEIFSATRLSKFLDIRRDEIKMLLKKLARYSVQDFAKVELKSMFSELNFNNIMRMVAGKRYFGENINGEEEAKQFRSTARELMSYGGVSYPGDFLPVFRWIDYQGYESKLKKLFKKVDGLLQGLIEEHRSNCGSNTMIDHLLSLQESEPDYYSDEIIKGLILISLFAGTDTTAVTLEWALSNLLNHPNILAKAKAELDTQIGQERVVDEADISKLPYLQCIILETLRLYPAAPLLVPHVSSQDCIIGGFNVPRGTLLLVNAWAIHRDPNLWSDPTAFKPERFENGESAEGHKIIPFGLGRRSCPGAGLAQRVLSLTLASLIQCFEWQRVGKPLVDMTEGRGVTMPKKIPLEALCKPRPIMNKMFSNE